VTPPLFDEAGTADRIRALGRVAAALAPMLLGLLLAAYLWNRAALPTP
jgi:hypothetical protein